MRRSRARNRKVENGESHGEKSGLSLQLIQRTNRGEGGGTAVFWRAAPVLRSSPLLCARSEDRYISPSFASRSSPPARLMPTSEG